MGQYEWSPEAYPRKDAVLRFINDRTNLIKDDRYGLWRVEDLVDGILYTWMVSIQDDRIEMLEYNDKEFWKEGSPIILIEIEPEIIQTLKGIEVRSFDAYDAGHVSPVARRISPTTRVSPAPIAPPSKSPTAITKSEPKPFKPVSPRGIGKAPAPSLFNSIGNPGSFNIWQTPSVIRPVIDYSENNELLTPDLLRNPTPGPSSLFHHESGGFQPRSIGIKTT